MITFQISIDDKGSVSRWVVNCSSRTLSTHKESVLSKRLNFSPSLRVIPKPAIIACDEKGTSRLPNGIAERTRLFIVGFLKISKPPTGSLTTDEL